DVLDRSEARLELVGVGVERARADMVVRVAIATVERQLVDEVVLDDRDLDFGERVARVKVTRNRRRRTALTSEIALLELFVNFEVQRFLAILDTEVRSDTRIGPRRLQAELVTNEGHVQVGDIFVDRAALETRGLKVVESALSNSTGLEDVVRDAACRRLDA